MALIPLKQTVTIQRKGEVDRWSNEVTAPSTFTLKCRIEEGAKLTRRTTYQQGTTKILAEEVVSSAQIYFDKFADVKLTDEIIYPDESGTSRTYHPININHIRGLNGRTLMTEVEV